MSLAVLKKKTMNGNPRQAPISGSNNGTFGFSLGYHYVAKENDTIYVKDKGNGVYTFDFCNLEFNSGSTTTNFTTNGNLTTQ